MNIDSRSHMIEIEKNLFNAINPNPSVNSTILSSDRSLFRFQMLFLRVTRKPLSLNVKTCCTFHAFRCPVTGLAAIAFHFTLPYLPLWQTSGFFFLITLVNCYITVWIIICRVLSTAGKSLSMNFKVSDTEILQYVLYSVCIKFSTDYKV
jgi:hypothetical protein